jgi:Icc-related predicted phosphoesterase
MSRNSIPNPSPGSDALAIISDIHGNLEALVSVLGYIESIGVQRIVCLGDIVGYGPNPVEYDYQVTADKIRANPLIRDIHADRLSQGR